MGFGWLKYSELKTDSINFNNVGIYLVFLKVVGNQKDVSIVSIENQKWKIFLHLLFGWFNELQKYVYTVSYVLIARSTHINGREKKSTVG